MNGDEEVHSGIIGLHGFLIGGLVDIGSPCVLHIYTTVLQNLTDRQCERKSVVFFLPAVIDRSRIAPSVAGIKHDRIRHDNMFLFRLFCIMICRTDRRCAGETRVPRKSDRKAGK